MKKSGKYIIGIDLGFPGTSHTVVGYHTTAGLRTGRWMAWAYWLKGNPDKQVCVPKLKHLDCLVALGVQPSQVVLMDELSNRSDIFTCSIDECKLIDSNVTFICIDEEEPCTS